MDVGELSDKEIVNIIVKQNEFREMYGFVYAVRTRVHIF